MNLQPTISFRALVISGAGRGRKIGTPTLNLALSDVPSPLKHGIYACLIRWSPENRCFAGAMHFGPRPVFNDDTACEIYVLDQIIEHAPATVDVEVLARLRDVENFPTPAALQQQIARDVTDTRVITQRHLE